MASNTIKIDLPGYGTVNVENIATEETLQKLLDAVNKLNKQQTAFSRTFTSTQQRRPQTSSQQYRYTQPGGAHGLNLPSNQAKQFANHLNRGTQGLGLFGKSTAGAASKLNMYAFALGVATNALFAIGAKSARLINEFSNVGDSVSGAAASMKNIPLIGQHLGDMFGAVAEQSEKLVRSYQGISSAGVTFGGSIHEMARAASDAGMTFTNFSNLLKNNSEALARIGGTAESGAKQFAKVSKSIRESGFLDQLTSLGYTTEEINSGILSYSKTVRSSALVSSMSTDQLAMSSVRYLKELDGLARATGVTRQEKEAEMEAIRTDAQFRLHTAKMSAEQREDLMFMIGSMPKELQQYAKEAIVTGGAMQTEGGRKFAVFYQNSMQQLLSTSRAVNRGARLSEEQAVNLAGSFERDRKYLVDSGLTETGKFVEHLHAILSASDANISEDNARRAYRERNTAMKSGNLAKTFESAQQKIAGASNEMALNLAKPEMIEQIANTYVNMGKVIQHTVVPIFNTLSSVITTLISWANQLFDTFVAGISKFNLMLDSWWLTIKEFWYDLKDLIPGIADATAAERAALKKEQDALAQERLRVEKEYAKKQNEHVEKEKKDQALLAATRTKQETDLYNYRKKLEERAAEGPVPRPGAAPGTAYTPTTEGVTNAVSKLEATMLAAVAKAEGTTDADAKKHGIASGYDVSFGYGKYGGGPGKPLTSMTLAEVREYQKRMLADPRNTANSSALGKYQFIQSTLKESASAVGAKDTDLFTPELQDKMGAYLLKKRGLGSYMSGKLSADQFQQNLAFEWASFANTSGNSAYGQRVGMSDSEVKQLLASIKSGDMSGVPGPAAKQIASAVVNQAATNLHAQTQAAINQGVKYKMGARDVSSGQIDCSGWVQSINTSLMKQINQAAGQEVFDQSAIRAVQGTAESIITQVANKTGVMITDPAAIKAGLQEGMLIGENNPNSKHDKDRKLGIDHIVQAVRDQATGRMMISQSSSGKGVTLMEVEKYFEEAMRKGKKLYATNPMALAKGGVPGQPISYPTPTTPATHQAAQNPLGAPTHLDYTAQARARLKQQYMTAYGASAGAPSGTWGYDRSSPMEMGQQGSLAGGIIGVIKNALIEKIQESGGNKYVKKGLESLVKHAGRYATSQINKATDYNGVIPNSNIEARLAENEAAYKAYEASGYVIGETKRSSFDSQMAAVKEAYREWEEVESKIKEKERSGFTADKLKNKLETDSIARQEEEKTRTLQQQEMLNKQPDLFERLFGSLSGQLGQLVNVTSNVADTNNRQLSVQKDMVENVTNTLF